MPVEGKSGVVAITRAASSALPPMLEGTNSADDRRQRSPLSQPTRTSGSRPSTMTTRWTWSRAPQPIDLLRAVRRPVRADARRDVRNTGYRPPGFPTFARRGEYLYNYWVDASQPRGHVASARRSRQYSTDSPRVGCHHRRRFAGQAADGENWVWASADVIEPEYTRALVEPVARRCGRGRRYVNSIWLTREFVADGFTLPEAKTDISWEDPDTCAGRNRFRRWFVDRIRLSRE